MSAVNRAAVCHPRKSKTAQRMRTLAERRQCWKDSQLVLVGGGALRRSRKSTIPLGAVLKHDWFELWYQPKIELRTHASRRCRGACTRAPSHARHRSARFVSAGRKRRGHARAHRAGDPYSARRLGNFSEYGVSIELRSMCRCRHWSSCQFPKCCVRRVRPPPIGPA